MIGIKLFSASGMSTSILADKMNEAAKIKGVDAEIIALPESQIDRYLDSMDVALLSPSIGYLLGKVKQLCKPKGIPIEVIPMSHYGMMEGAKVLDLALSLIKK